MQGSRIIKWLTILMLVLSLTICGGWIWCAQYQPSRFESFTFGSTLIVHEIDLWSLRKWQEDDQDWPVHMNNLIAEIPYELQYQHPRSAQRRQKFLNPVLVTDSLQFSEPSDLNVLISRKELTELVRRQHEETLPWLGATPAFGKKTIQSVVNKGAGSHRRIYWPGVAERFPDWAPLLLALTGLLTLAGFATLVVQRRALRNRLRAGRCANCGYDLRGINTKTCPECGNDHSSPDA